MMAKLGDVAAYINGYAFKPSDWSEDGMPIIRIQDLTRNSYQMNRFDGEIDSRYKVEPGDILISWSASLGVYVWEGEEALLNQHIFKVLLNKEKVLKSFYVHQVANILEKAGTQAHGATMKHLTRPVFNSLPFYLPNLIEQRKIADTLDKLDGLISKRKEQLAKLDELVKARFVELFGDPVTNPRGLPEATLPEIGEFGRGVSKHRPRNDPKLLGGEYPLIQTGDVAAADLYITKYTSTYSDLGLSQSKMWKKGTLCITIAANIAKTSILSFDACFPDSVVGFMANEKSNNIYVHYWFSFFQQILEAQAPESAQKNINMKILSELKVICPVKEKQDEFADFVSLIDTTKATVNRSLAALETLKKSLMQQYFG